MILPANLAHLSCGDEVGRIVVGQGCIYRVITPSAIERTKRLLSSGLIQELTEKELFPKTTVESSSNLGELVLKHELILPITFPYEWSPEMLRLAAKVTLEVNDICRTYGYELKDAHPFNCQFSYGRAVFVDFGSIVALRNKEEWVAKGEFVQSFMQPLAIAEKGVNQLYKHFFLMSGTSFAAGELWIVTSSISRFFGYRFSVLVNRCLGVLRRGEKALEESLNKRFRRKIYVDLIKLLAKRFRAFEPSRFHSKVDSYRFNGKSVWGSYHEDAGFYSDVGEINLSERLRWVANLPSKYGVSSVLDLAGNQGVLSRAIAAMPDIDHVVCADYDSRAIDKLAKSLAKHESVTPLCFDLMGDIKEKLTHERSSRLRSDLVLALAVTHHLTLTQGYSIDSVIGTLALYTNRYLVVEFMPLGLWDGQDTLPIPDWYNESWFSSAFSKHFELIERRQLETNRISYLGELRVKPQKIEHISNET